MRRSPLRRLTPLRRGSGLRRSGRVRAVSPRTEARRAERDEVRWVTLKRAGFVCEMRDLVLEVNCWHPDGLGQLDVDERVPRGRMPGSQYDATLTQAVCRAHHEWLDGHEEEARRLGLRAAVWDADRVRRPI